LIEHVPVEHVIVTRAVADTLLSELLALGMASHNTSQVITCHG
jgi:hypothetical protein